VHGRGAARWLGLAAAPTFAIMALLTGVLGGGAPDVLCSARARCVTLSGMVPMYLLMSAFHSAPWLKLICALRGVGGKARDRGESAPGVMCSQARDESLSLSGWRVRSSDRSAHGPHQRF
jgi:hypothetical protein